MLEIVVGHEFKPCEEIYFSKMNKEVWVFSEVHNLLIIHSLI